MNNVEKEVRFDIYCAKCKHSGTDGYEEPCFECLGHTVNIESHKPVLYDGPDIPEAAVSFDFKRKERITDYLYFMEYDRNQLNYQLADKYFRNREADLPPFGCSAVRNGDFFGRNLDWTYSDQAEFVVRVKGNGYHHGSIGVAGGFAPLTEDFVILNDRSPYYKVLPFQMYDGVNDCGVTVTMNVVPTDHGFNTSTPWREKIHSISSLMLIRFILDTFASAEVACNYIRDYVEVRFPESMHDMGYETHYMIADQTSTYILEFVGKRAEIIDASKKPYMTNFYILNTRFNQDGYVFTPANQIGGFNAMTYNNITPKGSGLERYNLIVKDYELGWSKSGMRGLLDELRYTRAYPSAPLGSCWYTEFVGARGLTCSSDPTDFLPVMAIADGYYRERTRTDGRTWQTTHSAVYDISNRTLSLCVQEEPTQYEFTLA